MSKAAEKPPGKIRKYDLDWDDRYSQVGIELKMIAKGGRYLGKGLGLFEHMMRARELLWPERYRHRWTELMYQNFIENDVTVLLGCASSQKTSHASEFVLINYLARPNNTLVILSTVNNEKLDIGVWAEVKMLWQEARDRWDDLAGNLVEYKRAIATDNIEEKSRDFRKGIIGRPCYSGGRWQGLGVLAGTKQDYIFYLADELQFMQEAFSASWPHLFSNGTVKIIGSGNPKHDDGDELAKTAEPVEGWAAMPEPQKTSVWKTKFMGAKAVNLVGTDSPNFDVPEDAPIPFPRLISRQFAKRIEHDFGKDSFQYYQLVKGVMRVAFAHSRVITRQLCRDHHAMENVEWSGSNQTMIYGLDPCYGGDDRCVGRWLKFGDDTTGHQILQLGPVEVFKVNLTKKQDAEDQIAEMVAERLDSLKIKPEDCFYDSFGKGTLGAAFARKFGFRVPTAVDAGGSPTERPVRDDLYMYEKDGSKRLKTCREHYKYFVSELWFSWRYTIEADQMRGLDEPTMAEGCARIYEMVEGNKIQVEPKSDPKKKEDLKRRLGKSPDLADCTVIGVEGARQRGFRISRLGAKIEGVEKEVDFFDQEVREYERTLKKFTLVH